MLWLANLWHGEISSPIDGSALYPLWWILTAVAMATLLGLGVAASLVDRRWRLLSGIWQFQIRDVYFVALGVIVTLFGNLLDIALAPTQGNAAADSWAPPQFNATNAYANLVGPRSTFFVVAVLAVVALPVVHELFFRGVLLRALGAVVAKATIVTMLGEIVIVSLVSCVAGALFDVRAWPTLFIISAISSWVFLRRQRLWPSVFIYVGIGLTFLWAWYVTFILTN